MSLSIKPSLWQEGNIGHIDELVVDSKERHKGIGTKLINEITRIAKGKNCRRIELDSAFHREDAHKFYASIGFENRAFLFSKKLD